MPTYKLFSRDVQGQEIEVEDIRSYMEANYADIFDHVYADEEAQALYININYWDWEDHKVRRAPISLLNTLVFIEVPEVEEPNQALILNTTTNQDILKEVGISEEDISMLVQDNPEYLNITKMAMENTAADQFIDQQFSIKMPTLKGKRYFSGRHAIVTDTGLWYDSDEPFARSFGYGLEKSLYESEAYEDRGGKFDDDGKPLEFTNGTQVQLLVAGFRKEDYQTKIWIVQTRQGNTFVIEDAGLSILEKS